VEVYEDNKNGSLLIELVPKAILILITKNNTIFSCRNAQPVQISDMKLRIFGRLTVNLSTFTT